MPRHAGQAAPLSFDSLMGEPSGRMGRALSAGREFLARTPVSELLASVGETIEAVPPAGYPDKRWFQRSYGRAVTDKPDDLLVGRGLFYLTEQRRLFLDCTAGHYQMTWGYDHPELRRVLLDGIERGIVWDNHSNIPAAPVKRLAAKLIELANPGAGQGVGLESPTYDCLRDDDDSLNTVLTGCATGSVACAAAMKMMLVHFAREKRQEGPPVFVALDGNYHGTDLLAQRLRGMWPEYFASLEVVMVQPNDAEELQQVFRQHGERVAGLWAEPIMMNREAIPIEPEYLQLARSLCDETGALMALDEIQTGFWFPEVIYAGRMGVEPDFIVLGKGMTAGFHPLAALVYRGRLDLLEQYDAISTNGNAALAAYLALGCIALIEREAQRIGQAGEYYHERMAELAAEFPDLLVEARGVGHLSGLKFHQVEDALGFHRSAVERGLWIRAHAYHEGHSTILTKFALPMDLEVADFAVGAMRDLLVERPWRR
jgi:acetylornithine/succinyldiaminopimelate/putrescine aminotransferase